MENKQTNKTPNRKWLWLALTLAVLVAAMITVYALTRPQTNEAQKTLQLSIVTDTTKQLTLHTQQAFLRGALEEQKLIAGDESEYGLFVKTVDGYTVDDSKQEWWCFTKGGETVMTGVDSTPIADGESYEITLKTGY